MSENKFYPTKADITVKEVNISSAQGQHLTEIIGLWQFLNWDESLKVLQLMRGARRENWDASQKEKKKVPEPVTRNPSEHDVAW